MVTNIGHIVILSYTWKIACTNASSVVTVASNESGMDLFLSVAQAVGSHHIVTGSIKKMTWKNERIYHRVLCPLLGYWRRAKKRKRRRESTGERDEDRSEYVRVFETFFESICPYAKKCVIDSCRLKQILLLDCEGFCRL